MFVGSIGELISFSFQDKMDKDFDNALAKRSWDCDPAGGTDFVRCARLLYEKTTRKKRRQLGPLIVSQPMTEPG